MLPFRFPFLYPPNYYNNYANYNNYRNRPSSTELTNAKNTSHNYHNPTSTAEQNDTKPKTEKNNSKSNSKENYFFELFGLKLYFDDIILICLLFFLYQEGVQDEELFIGLILLLLS